VFSQRKVDRIRKNVWETIKCIGSSLEAEDDDFDNDLSYTTPNNPLKPIFA
jgi:hypothetical protein